MYAQTPQDMTRALFEAQLVELQRARAIRKKYHTDVVLGLTSAIRVLLIDMPSPYDKIKLLDYLHIVVEEPRFRSSHEGVKFHAYTATLPPDRTPDRTLQRDRTSRQTAATPETPHTQTARSHKKVTRDTTPFAAYENSKYAPFFVEPHIFTVHPLLLWVQMAAYLRLEELVVLGDAMTRRSFYRVHVSPANFVTLLNELPTTFPHRKKCDKAVKLLAENTDSCMETRLRFRMLRAGYGPFVINYRLTLNTADKKQAFLDIAIPNLKIAIEYSGKFHAQNWESDEARRTALSSAGWQILSVNAETLSNSGKFKDFLIQLSMTIARQQTILQRNQQM